jgi:hypothetical protein
MLRDIAAIVAILATVLTAGVAGAARGQAAAAGEIVICSGQGPATIYLDAEGNPTGTPHWCPDCVLTLFAAVSAPALPPVAGAACIDCAYPGHHAGLRAGLAPVPQARGPPVTV